VKRKSRSKNFDPTTLLKITQNKVKKWAKPVSSMLKTIREEGKKLGSMFSNLALEKKIEFLSISVRSLFCLFVLF
jgi:hypothetical protein